MNIFTRVLLIALFSGRAAAGIPDCVPNSGNGHIRTRKAAVDDFRILDVNRLNAVVLNNGKIGEDPRTGGDGLWYPGGQKEKSLIFTSGLWVLGRIDEEIRSAAAYYATEFQPGRILPDGTPDDSENPAYAVRSYRYGETVNAEAAGLGCPAEVIGDQMVFSVFNDLTSHAAVWQEQPIGLEVRLTGWAYNRTDALGEALFFRFHFTNRGDKALEDAYAGLFFDPDVGSGNDDNAGTDEALDLVYAFNGNDTDQKYGRRVPAVGCDLLQGPIVDSPHHTAVLPDGTVLPGRKMLGMTTAFIMLCVSPIDGMSCPPLQDPGGCLEAYYFMWGYKGNGEFWQDPTRGDAPTVFPFAGDPVSGTGWLLAPYIGQGRDVKMGFASGPFDLETGESQELFIALVAGTGDDYLSSVTVMKENDRIVQEAYSRNFDLSFLDSGAAEVPYGFGLLQNYPNPFNRDTVIRFVLGEDCRVRMTLFNSKGIRIAEVVDGPFRQGEHEIHLDGSALPSGVYLCRMEAGGVTDTMQMVILK